MKKSVIFCLCVAVFHLTDGVKMSAALQERIEEAKVKSKQPQSMFDRPKLDSIDIQVDLGQDVFPYPNEIMVGMAAKGPTCRRLGQECGALYLPCCKKDPDTNEPVDLICQYPEEADVTKTYVAGHCAENPNPPPIKPY